MAAGTGSNAGAGSSGSDYLALLAAQNGVGNPMFNKTTTDTTYLTQTSQPDISALLNSTMQQLLGRNATPEEIQTYGSELLAAEKANVGKYTGETTYGPSGKRNLVSGTQTTVGVDPQAFFANILRGTAEAKQYGVMNTYMDALQNATDKFKGSYNG